MAWKFPKKLIKFVCFSLDLGVMRNKRRNTYVVNNPHNIDITSNASLSNSLAQSNTTNNYLSSTTAISSSMFERPTHESMKSTNSLDDNHRSHELPHQMQHSQYSQNSIDLPSTTESSTTDLVTRTWNVNSFFFLN